MKRSFAAEIIENPALPEETLAEAHAGLALVHRYMGNSLEIARRIRSDPRPVERVLDIGCGNGAVLGYLRQRLGVEVVGVDVRPSMRPAPGVRILEQDALASRLPECDVAIAVCVAHHLTDDEFIRLVNNVRRSARRFIVLDLVRHPLPLRLFRMFVAPWLPQVNRADGVLSIERSYTVAEMRALAREAAEQTGAEVRHTVGPLYARQIVDFHYRDFRYGRSKAMWEGSMPRSRHQEA